ncbi:MAG: iron-only hydrogenase system regulator [Deltaproteobacteria bacterium]|nr:iron-only hydrogenase system regulator [Deltaproteobacteria bacterium]
MSEYRVAIIGVVVTEPDSVDELNRILHQYASFIIGRMGIPYHAKNINLISVAIDAPAETINALAGKIGSLAGVSAKTVYSL